MTEAGGQGDQPTSAAHLVIRAEPTKGVSALGSVPPQDAPHMITTFGITATFATTMAAVAMVRDSLPLTLAVIAAGLIAIALIALDGQRQEKRRAQAVPAAGVSSEGNGRGTTAAE
jgi:hypothetical protein